MLPFEKIEIAIYRLVKNYPDGRAVSVSSLASVIGPDVEGPVVIQRLMDLYRRELVALFKFVGQVRVSYAQYAAAYKSDQITWKAVLKHQKPYYDWERNFFYNGEFIVEITPKATPYFEELDRRDRAESEEQVVFVSCGQWSDAERKLGRELSAAVDELLPPFRGYFAQNENSLDALSRNIFSALQKCAGFVAVLHHRGVVETPNGNHTRASVWIEQEIAIAAFLAQVFNKGRIPVAVYIQKGIKREGVRELLTLNLEEFETEQEVLANFREQLKSGRFKPPVR